MNWKSKLSRRELEILENRASKDFGRVARAALTIGLIMFAKRGMTQQQRLAFDNFRRQRILSGDRRDEYQIPGISTAKETSWFEQIEDKISQLVEDAAVYVDDHTGGHGQRGTVWAEKKLDELSADLRAWWNA